MSSIRRDRTDTPAEEQRVDAAVARADHLRTALIAQLAPLSVQRLVFRACQEPEPARALRMLATAVSKAKAYSGPGNDRSAVLYLTGSMLQVFRELLAPYRQRDGRRRKVFEMFNRKLHP